MLVSCKPNATARNLASEAAPPHASAANGHLTVVDSWCPVSVSDIEI
jgi:hypothetical protein